MAAKEERKAIPTVDLSPFFQEHDDVAGKKKARDAIDSALRNYGFFRVVGHGMSKPLMNKAIGLAKDFFGRKDDEKMKSSSPFPCTEDSPMPIGYTKPLPEVKAYNSETLMMLNPVLGLNVYPSEPTEYRSTLEDCFFQLSETARLLVSILTECMGLPPNSIKDFDKDLNTDLLLAVRYYSISADDNYNATGLLEHQDESCITLVFQDEVEGLEVMNDGEWIPIDPEEGSIIVNVGDIIQVMSNGAFKSALHRVRRTDRDRYSYVLFFNVDKDRWIEPLPQFSTEIGVPPKYKRFQYKDYLKDLMEHFTIPTDKYANISRYAV